jgi:hypothetical protein
MNEHVRSADLAREFIDAAANPPPSRKVAMKRSFRPFPIDSLPEPLARFVLAVAASTSTDPSWAALAALAVIAGCIGNRVAIILKKGWVEPAILWAALVGKSGSAKSVVLRLVRRPLVELFKREREAMARLMNEYQVQMERHHLAMQAWKCEQKSGPPTDPPLEPEKPRERRVLASDITVEKIASLLNENPMGILIMHDELAKWVNSFNRYAGGKGSDLQSWLSMNDGNELIVDRKTDGSTFVERASVSIGGTIQPYTLARVFGTMERETGLLARIHLAYPPDRLALWSEQELSDDIADEWRDLLDSLLALEPLCNDDGGWRPRLIGLAPDAKRVFIAWHNRHVREVAELTDEHLRAHWSKLKGTCARIALLFVCTEAVSGLNVTAVSAECITRATEVTEWLKHESARIYASMNESEENQELLALERWIEQRGGVVTVRDLTHNFSRFRGNAQAARNALNVLVNSQVGHWVPTVSKKGGQPTDRFELFTCLSNTNTNTPAGAIKNEGIGVGVSDEEEKVGDEGASEQAGEGDGFQ